MPDFSATFTAGVTLEAWTDPPDPSRPSRLNASANHGHLRRRGSIGAQVTVAAMVSGVVAPLDAALGGRLFFGMFAEAPAMVPAITTPVGQSSVQRFTPAAAGHYTFVLRRESGGALFMHLDVT